MKVQYCSDLHLEFPLNEKHMSKYPLEVKGDILILAGDIVPFSIMDKYKDFFNFVSDNFQQVFWIPGNHEYYHSDIKERSGRVFEEIRKNVFLVNNYDLVINGIAFIFSTLWSKINPVNDWQTERAMSDFHVIKNNGYRLSVPAFNQLHHDCFEYVQQVVAANKAHPKVVVTHHIPTFMHYPKQFVGDILSDAFAVELHDFIEPSGIHSWIFGHHHVNIPDFQIGKTTLRTNQLGYVKYGEHRDFMRGKVFEV